MTTVQDCQEMQSFAENKSQYYMECTGEWRTLLNTADGERVIQHELGRYTLLRSAPCWAIRCIYLVAKSNL